MFDGGVVMMGVLLEEVDQFWQFGKENYTHHWLSCEGLTIQVLEPRDCHLIQ